MTPEEKEILTELDYVTKKFYSLNDRSHIPNLEYYIDGLRYHIKRIKEGKLPCSI